MWRCFRCLRCFRCFRCFKVQVLGFRVSVQGLGFFGFVMKMFFDESGLLTRMAPDENGF